MLKKHSHVPGHELANKSLSDLLINSFQVKNFYCQYFSGRPFENVNEEIYETAINNLRKFYFVGKFESYNNSFKNLCKKLNLKDLKVPNINQNKYTEINDDQKKLIMIYNKYDIKLYNEYFTENI
jgi:hypothetical protein